MIEHEYWVHKIIVNFDLKYSYQQKRIELISTPVIFKETKSGYKVIGEDYRLESFEELRKVGIRYTLEKMLPIEDAIIISKYNNLDTSYLHLFMYSKTKQTINNFLPKLKEILNDYFEKQLLFLKIKEDKINQAKLITENLQ